MVYLNTLDNLYYTLIKELNIIKDKLTALMLTCKENDIEFTEYDPNDKDDWYHSLYINDAQVYVFKLTPYSIYGYVGVNNGDSERLWRLNNKEFIEVWFSKTSDSDWSWKVKEWDKINLVYK